MTNGTSVLNLRSLLTWFYNAVNTFDGPQAEAIFVACIVFTIGLTILGGCFLVGRLNDSRHPQQNFSYAPNVVPASAQAYDYDMSVSSRFGKPRENWQ